LRISRQLLDEVVAHARAEAPKECCGMIAASDGRAVSVHRARNAARVPKQRYEMHGQDQYDILMAIDEAGNDIGAIYHSHPRTEPKPSQTDINLADKWPDPLYVIVGLEHPEAEVRAWRIVDGAASEAPLEVDDGPATAA
jgi:proteasome lid subunit RPN8/RPN11